MQEQYPGVWLSTAAAGLCAVQASVKRNTSVPAREATCPCLFDIIYPGQANQDIEILHAFSLAGADNLVFFDRAF
jgi:hypothetical protein